MNEKSEMDILYEQYLENHNRTYEQDGILRFFDEDKTITHEFSLGDY